MKANLKNILIIVPLIIFMWAWNTYADLPAAARTAPTSTNSHSLSAELAQSSADTEKIMGGHVLIATEEFNLRPENIKKDVEIYGVTGTYDGKCVRQFKNWCDNGDGTVTNMKTRLTWLKNAGWGGARKISVGRIWQENAYHRANSLHDRLVNANLFDGSQQGDWRLPTKSELKELWSDNEVLSSGLFTGVEEGLYWTSTTSSNNNSEAWSVNFSKDENQGEVEVLWYKFDKAFVWPVRGELPEEPTIRLTMTPGMEWE